MSDIRYGSLPFDESIQFFRNKLTVNTDTWSDIWRTAHARAFMVAGAKDDLLLDLRRSVDKFIAEGKTINDFRKDFDAIVKRRGWAYNGGRNWRTRIIYDTNLRQAHHAGRWSQIQRIKHKRPYLMYKHNTLLDPRDEHKTWDGLVLPVDSPFWASHYPQNGWGCKCTVRSLSKRDVEQKGLQVANEPNIKMVDRLVKRDGVKQIIRVPEGIDPGFDYNVGQAWYKPFTPQEDAERILKLATKPPTLPLPRATKITKEMLLPTGKSNEYYANQFLAQFGTQIGTPVPFKDKAGGHLLISEALFQNVRGNWKVQKEGRERYLLLLADTIKNPDEVWVWMEKIQATGQYVLRRRYLKHLDSDDGNGFVLFEWGKHSWQFGVSAYTNKRLKFEQLRVGTLVWSEEGQE